MENLFRGQSATRQGPGYPVFTLRGLKPGRRFGAFTAVPREARGRETHAANMDCERPPFLLLGVLYAWITTGFARR